MLNCFNHEVQLNDTEFAIRNKLIDFSEFKDFKLVATLVLEFKKIQSDDKTLTIINEKDIDDVF